MLHFKGEYADGDACPNLSSTDSVMEMNSVKGLSCLEETSTCKPRPSIW